MMRHGHNPRVHLFYGARYPGDLYDLPTLVDLAATGASLVYDPTVVFRYRRHRASVSSVQAVDGRRFAEENRFFADEARRCADLGWPKAARAARLHATSRLHHAQALLGAAVVRVRHLR